MIPSLLLTLLLAASDAAAASAPAPTPGGAEATTVRGTVVDLSGAAVGGAIVQLRVDRLPRRKTVSDVEGRYEFRDVPPGGTRLEVRFAGFAPFAVDLDETRTEMKLVLEPASRTEEVTVQAEAGRITTATRTDTPLHEVPQAVGVVSREVISDQKMRSMADVMRYVAGAGAAQGEGNRDQPILRGNSSTSDLFVDGVRDDVQYLRDLYNVERVEVLKGPNAMIFGRGGVGGVVNRVVRQADGSSSRDLTVQGGSWDERRATGDIGHAFSPRAALRATGMYENSGSYREGVKLERYGVNPTVALSLGARTTLRAGYEHFHDGRTADRGVPSFAGRPLDVLPETFFGSAENSQSRVTVNAFSSALEHRPGTGVVLRTRLSLAEYDKFYQNVFPGAVNTARSLVNLSAYNNATERRNLFSQTDLVLSRRTGRLEHTLLAGMELGRQVTDNLRNTGYFASVGPTVTSVSVPLANPTTALPVEFRPSATDANNHGLATVAGFYAQDQVALTKQVQAIVGLRYDRFAVDFRNNRTATELESRDGLLSPRLGLVVKPVTPLALYASYTRSYLPRAGEQLSSLSATNQALDPETFQNYELGAKYELRPALSLTAAMYRLDRGNVAVPSPTDPAVSVLVDGQRAEGVELDLSGRLTNAWSVLAAYAYQDAKITRSISATAQAGARLAQVPEHTFSLWNKYELSRTWSLALGVVHRGDVFTSTDNRVVLPSFTRVDGAAFYTAEHFRVQVNLENALGTRYFSNAHTNDNITPGAPRGLRVSLSTRF